MFRVEVQHATTQVVIKLEGQLAGEFAEVARMRIAHLPNGVRQVVDLTDLTSIDAAGEQLLLMLKFAGAEFVADNTYSRYLCERLDLIAERPATSSSHKRTRS